MKISKAFFVGITLVVTALFLFSIYFYTELHALKKSISSQALLSKNDVITLVDERLASLEKRKAKMLLSSLKSQFQLAQMSTPDNRLIYGDVNARFTIQEFGDIECPYCRKMNESIKHVVNHSQGTINWEFKHFPLNGHNPVAAIESQAIECVKEAYNNRIAWIALDKFMADSAGNGKGVGDISEFVRSFGINGSLIGNCLASDDHKGTINRDYEDGRRLGITATPAILLQDKKTSKDFLIKGFKTSEQLLQAIQEIL